MPKARKAMRSRWRLAAWAALVLAPLAGCDVEVANKAIVYPPVSGLVEVRWRLGVKGIRNVDYSLDGQAVGSSSNATTNFATQIDSAKFPNGAHTFRASAIDPSGLPVQTVEHLFIIQN
jgi:hypothetical protein